MLRAGLAGGAHPSPPGTHRWAWACMPAAAPVERGPPSPHPMCIPEQLWGEQHAESPNRWPQHLPTVRVGAHVGQGPGAVCLHWPPCPCPGRLCWSVCRAEWPRLAGAFAVETAGVSAILALSSLFLFLSRLFLSSCVFLFKLGLRAASRPGCHLYHRQPSCRWCVAGRRLGDAGRLRPAEGSGPLCAACCRSNVLVLWETS